MPDTEQSAPHAVKWTIAVGDGFHFDVEEVTPRPLRDWGNNCDLNGKFDTKLDALRDGLASLLDTRVALNYQIARVRRLIAYQQKNCARQ